MEQDRAEEGTFGEVAAHALGGGETDWVQIALSAGAIIGTWFWDLREDRLTVDRPFVDAFGLDPAYGRTGLRADQVLASVHPEDRQGLEAAIADAVARGGSYAHEYRVRRADGSYHWIEASGRVEHAADGTPLRFPGVLIDREQRHAMETDRDRAHALARTIMEAVPGVVYAKDREGRFLMGNRGTAELIGLPPERFLGRTDLDVLGDRAQAERVMANDRRIMESGVSEQIEEEVRRPDGTPACWLSTKKPLCDAHGMVIGLVGSSLDITARKEAESQRQALNETLEKRVAAAIAEREKVEEAMRQTQKMEAVGQLTGGVAHDFNNMLTVIRGSVDLLRRPDLPEERRRRYLDAVSDTVDRAATLTRQLLAFARRQALRPETFNVRQRIHGVAEMLDAITGSRVTIVLDVPDEECFVHADLSQFETALVNMAINARDAMGDQGTVVLRLRCADALPAIRGHGAAPGPFVAVSVLDTGEGIPPERLGSIFEPFFTTKPVGKGTGLGLSQVFGFAKQSGGDIDVESRVGRGSTFTLYLPRVASPAPVEAVRSEAEATHGRGRRVLVVEDNVEVGRFAKQILEDLGYQAHWVVNAEAALDALDAAETEVDLVFSDVVMPGMGGIELARILERRFPDLPVILASGYSHVLAADGEHRFRLLHKPYSAEQLSCALRDAKGGGGA